MKTDTHADQADEMHSEERYENQFPETLDDSDLWDYPEEDIDNGEK